MRIGIYVLLVLALIGCKNNTGKQVYIPVPYDFPLVLDTVWNMEQIPIRKRDSIMRVEGDQSENFKYYHKLVKKNHAINEIKVKNILDHYGWPSHEDVGDRGNWTISNVLQHSSLEVREHYIPLMKQAVLDGQLEARFLVRAEDRIATDKGELQLYGGQMKYYPETKSFNLWPVYDPENIDKRRAEIGLDPIAVFLKDRFDFEWDLEEQIARSKAFEEAKTK